MFEHYDIQETIHSSSDGQRIETQVDTINARFSSKYFGLKKGISSYTLLANHVPINAKTIGAQEHESHYVFDVLYSNTTDIIPSGILPIPTAPTKSISGFCMCLDMSSRRATATCTRK
jgi:TnpA family transposase